MSGHILAMHLADAATSSTATLTITLPPDRRRAVYCQFTLLSINIVFDLWKFDGGERAAGERRVRIDPAIPLDCNCFGTSCTIDGLAINNAAQ